MDVSSQKVGKISKEDLVGENPWIWLKGPDGIAEQGVTIVEKGKVWKKGR